MRLVASKGGDDGSVHINQDVKLYASIMSSGDEVIHVLADGRHAWVQLISGSLEVNGEELQPGDGAAVSDEPELKLKSGDNGTEFLLFDLN